MKKFLIAGLTTLVLVASASTVFAKDLANNLDGKVSLIYSPTNSKIELAGIGAKEDTTTIGGWGEIALTKKIGIAGSYMSVDFKDTDNDDAWLNIDGTYNLANSKDTGKIDGTIGYMQMGDDDSKVSGFGLGVKGSYNTAYKAVLDYKLSYVPSLTSDTIGFDEGNALQYRVGIEYPVKKNVSVVAGYHGNTITEKLIVGTELTTSLDNFYVGAGIKF